MWATRYYLIRNNKLIIIIVVHSIDLDRNKREKDIRNKRMLAAEKCYNIISYLIVCGLNNVFN